MIDGRATEAGFQKALFFGSRALSAVSGTSSFPSKKGNDVCAHRKDLFCRAVFALLSAFEE